MTLHYLTIHSEISSICYTYLCSLFHSHATQRECSSGSGSGSGSGIFFLGVFIQSLGLFLMMMMVMEGSSNRHGFLVFILHLLFSSRYLFFECCQAHFVTNIIYLLNLKTLKDSASIYIYIYIY